jgi:uncharacterized protein (TIGR02271 family)
MARARSGSPDDRHIPVHEETVDVSKRTLERRAQIDKRVHARTETVETVLRHERPVVERVAINRVVAEPPPVRQEGDTLVIPVLEEVAVVERRLMLREEIRVRREEIAEPFRQDVTLRTEEVVFTPPSRDEVEVSSTHSEQGKED